VFALREAAAAEIWSRTGKPVITLGPPDASNPDDYTGQHVRPAVSTVAQASALKATHPVLAIDTGMQRFACPTELVEEALTAGNINEVFAHATTLHHVSRLLDITSQHMLKRHAAATALLDEPKAWLDAVRPGLACYRGALRVSTTLHETRVSQGPIGYGGFFTETGHHGVILAGYSNGIKAGLCLVNGEPRRIMEVGMQSAYVELQPADHRGDEVILVGDELSEADVAGAWQMSEHQAVLHLAQCGQRTFAE
jgi:alanine racemase